MVEYKNNSFGESLLLLYLLSLSWLSLSLLLLSLLLLLLSFLVLSFLLLSLLLFSFLSLSFLLLFCCCCLCCCCYLCCIYWRGRNLKKKSESIDALCKYSPFGVNFFIFYCIPQDSFNFVFSSQSSVWQTAQTHCQLQFPLSVADIHFESWILNVIWFNSHHCGLNCLKF